jgi:phytoene dehydrogenase-like protein
MAAATSKRDVIVLGAGPNGLTAAAYLAKAGHRPIVLERRPVVGGLAVTEEFAPGFRCSTVLHGAGPFRPSIVRDLGLERHGLSFIQTEVRVFAPSADPNGRGIALYGDAARTARELETLSKHDGGGLARVPREPRPHRRRARPARRDDAALDRRPLVRRAVGALRRRPQVSRLPRGATRSGCAALGADGRRGSRTRSFFDTELLRAAVAARGIFGAFAGPWSAGTSLGLIVQSAFAGTRPGRPRSCAAGWARSPRRSRTAAQGFGAEIRTNAEVTRVSTRNGAVSGVVLASGEEIPADAVVSNADPKRTLLGLVDPVDLDPDFLQKMRNYPRDGEHGEGQPRPVRAPDVPVGAGRGRQRRHARRAHPHRSGEIDYLERAYDAAKYGDFSPHPWCEATIPTVTDQSLAPEGKHVMSVIAQFAPYKLKGGWGLKREALGDAVVAALAAHAPGIESLIEARQVLTPEDLETTFGATGGHVLHGEPAIDQLFTMRPLTRLGRSTARRSAASICAGRERIPAEA